MSSAIIYHRHHIVPKYLGGTNDATNIIKVNPKMHAFLHWQLYKEHGNWQDIRACIGLLGLDCTIDGDCPKEWARKQKIKQYWEEYRQGKHPKRTAHNKGVRTPEEIKKKLRKPKTEEHKAKLRKAASKKDTSNMGKYERTELTKKKLSEAVKAIPKSPCQYCSSPIAPSALKKHEKACKYNPINFRTCPVCNENKYFNGTSCSYSCSNRYRKIIKGK